MRSDYPQITPITQIQEDGAGAVGSSRNKRILLRESCPCLLLLPSVLSVKSA